ncbi:EVE domain-containing protein [Tepidimonas fonticaldi]|uniref:EVE domain-containing protein n=1 Tax=Tepidimonas fonticaldi TaxID=1101373 RepID=UPI0028C4ED89|nr:EVE domain-containing protein [Tepidimonas fonticaldi]
MRKTRLLCLKEMRERPELADLLVLKPANRLSITPVTPDQWRRVLTALESIA